MSQFNIVKALRTQLESLSLGIPLQYPNFKEEDPNAAPAGSVTFHFNQPSVATLGESGDDNHDGFMQILLKYPVGKGDKAIMEMADTIRQGFVAGFKCQYGSQTVTILSCGVGLFDHLDDKFVTPITINWYARTRR